ncbi:transcriptional regulator [Bacillus sp. AFS002410]|uniref:transcriptional regulator n=1 Tax=Bacillus sp. AFS002410 TaxID=2033481 RepID=UPI000BF1BFDA|nr:transcriptional regulator [Bacillus sp. AFS002410]PEJ57976.1 transcriptional regulator [Bacillus sp. AFS002410]
MIGVDVTSLPYQQKITYKAIRYIRLCRNLTQTQFRAICKIDQGVLAKLERNELPLTLHYEIRILDGCSALNLTDFEMLSVKRLVDLQQQRGL